MKRLLLPEASDPQPQSTLAMTEILRMSLAQEFQTLASLRHPHIISVLDYGFDADRQPFFTMEYLHNASTIVAAGLNLSLEDRIDLVIQMLLALTYLHRRGILHRDLKPGNVLVVGGRVHLLDFGLSVPREQASGTVGTIMYMAPEVVREEPQDERTDLYAVGVILYELIAGKHPFEASTSNKLLVDILVTPPDIDSLDTTEDLKVVLGRLLAKDPAARYSTAVEAIRALSSAIDRPSPPETQDIRESFLQAAAFVGRHQEVARLSQALEQMLDGQGSVWLVGGESGSGKSRLLDELRIRALVKGVLVLRGQGVAAGGLSYQHWREPVRRLVLSSQLTAFQAGILKQIVPDIDMLLGITVPDVPPLEGDAGHRRLLLGIAALFGQQQHPVLLILEDLHWAAESLDVVRQLQLLAGNMQLMIVGDYQNDERADLLDELPGVEVLTLSRLGEKEMSDLSASILGDAGRREEVLDLLRQETEGNVYFMVEVLRALAEEAGGLDSIGQMELPDRIFAEGVLSVIQRRIDRVPEWDRPLLALAAAAGRRLDLDVLRYIVSHQSAAPSLDDWLTACTNAAVLAIQDAHWQFAHDRLRDALLSRLSASERAALHGQIAVAIEAVYPDDTARSARLVQHWVEAGNRERECHYAALAGDEALRIGSLADALSYYEQSFALLPEDDDAANAGILLKIAEVLNKLGDFSEGSHRFQQSLELARRVADSQIEARALAGWGWALRMEGNVEEAKQVLEQGLEVARASNDLAGMAVLNKNLGVAWYATMEEARRYFLEGLRLYREIGDQVGIGNSLNNLGIISNALKDLESAQTYHLESLEIRRRIDDRFGMANSLHNIGNVARALGDYASALHSHKEALATFHELGSRWSIAASLVEIGHDHVFLGQNESAWDAYREALAEAAALENTPLIVEIIAGASALHIQAGDLDRAARWLGFVIGNSNYNPDIAKIAEPLIDQLRSRMDTSAIEAVMKEGEHFSLEQLVEELVG